MPVKRKYLGLFLTLLHHAMGFLTVTFNGTEGRLLHFIKADTLYDSKASAGFVTATKLSQGIKIDFDWL